MVVNCVTMAVTMSTVVEFEKDKEELSGTGYDELKRQEVMVRKLRKERREIVFMVNE